MTKSIWFFSSSFNYAVETMANTKIAYIKLRTFIDFKTIISHPMLDDEIK